MYDAVIVGGGIMGSSVAYHLLSFAPHLKLVVVEKDPLYTFASTPLSLGGIRVQFSLKENILISLYAQEAFTRFEEEMAVGEEKPADILARLGGQPPAWLAGPRNRTGDRTFRTNVDALFHLTKAAMPPAFCASAMTCSATVVLPEDSGPKISEILPRG